MLRFKARCEPRHSSYRLHRNLGAKPWQFPRSRSYATFGFGRLYENACAKECETPTPWQSLPPLPFPIFAECRNPSKPTIPKSVRKIQHVWRINGRQPYLIAELKQRGLWDAVMINDLKYFNGSVQPIDRVPDDIKACSPPL